MLASVAHIKLRLSQASLVICMLALVFAPSVTLATDATDIATGLSTLPLMTGRAYGTVPIAVIYDPANEESKADAQNIMKSLEQGIGVPRGLSIDANLVSITEISQLQGTKVAFLAKDINEDRVDSVCEAAGKNGILTISTNINCVRANRCILAVITKPRIQIYYSPVAAEASHISFAPEFIMLVKQL